MGKVEYRCDPWIYKLPDNGGVVFSLMNRQLQVCGESVPCWPGVPMVFPRAGCSISHDYLWLSDDMDFRVKYSQTAGENLKLDTSLLH